MSWDAALLVSNGLDGDAEVRTGVGDWNYTYNTTPMLVRATEGAWFYRHPTQTDWCYTRDPDGECRWAHRPRTCRRLDGMSGADGAHFLAAVIASFEAHPDDLRALNPPNGWGDYDSLLAVLRDMAAKSAAWPDAVWSIQ